jgi:hypothetical protein
MIKTILTLDYEIHGNGYGSPRALMVEPTHRLLRLCDRYGAKLTIMADVAEILKFREYLAEHGRDDYAYQDICEQLRDAVRGGHDVQLHVHSSYFNSTFRGDHWEQDYAEYDLARLPPARVNEVVARGKGFLVDLLRPVRPLYRCIAFRAANWSMSPSHDIARALIDNGIVIDSSVFKYGRRADLVHFDYASAHADLVPWPASIDDVCRMDPNGDLFEFPIYCENRRISHFLTANRVYRAFQCWRNPLPREAASEPSSTRLPVPGRVGRYTARARELVRLMTAPQAWKLDFNQATCAQLIAGLSRAERRHRDVRGDLPVTLIGHSKLFSRWNELTFEPFLAHVARSSDRFGFATFGDFDLARFRAASGRVGRLDVAAAA